MKNVTISMDEHLLESGRNYAKANGTTLNALLRQALKEKVNYSKQQWLKGVFDLMDKANGNSGGKTWSREELYER